tara:strand:- start:137 stop:430 length:294 start_codon:yes stop_codon:yes gene_type:complete
MTENKTFINGLFIREKTFDNGGSIIKIDVDVYKLTQQLEQLKNEKGYVSIDLKKRQQKSDNGLTHYAEQNTFIPKKQTQQNQQGNSWTTGDDNDIPF